MLGPMDKLSTKEEKIAAITPYEKDKDFDKYSRIWQNNKFVKSLEGNDAEVMQGYTDDAYLTLKNAMKNENIMKKKQLDVLIENIIRKVLKEGVDRPIYQIAQEIKTDWKKVSPYAKPYLDAMFDLDKITDKYIADSGSSIVAYFLGNAKSWTGEKVKEIKAELNQMLKVYYNRNK